MRLDIVTSNGVSNTGNKKKTQTDTYLHFQYFPAGTLWKVGAGLLGRFLRTQSIRNCLGDLPVQLRDV